MLFGNGEKKKERNRAPVPAKERGSAVGSLWFIVRGNENPSELEIHNNGDKVIAALLSG